MARPPFKDRDLVRSKTVKLYASPLQLERWRKAAAKEGLTLSAWIRRIGNRAARMG